MTEIAKIAYEAPRIKDIGSLVELTAKAKFDNQVPALQGRKNDKSSKSSNDTTGASGPATLTSSGSW